MSHITVCVYVCQFVLFMFVCVVCSLVVASTCVMDRGRRAQVSPWQPTCLWPFIKPGGVEEREGLTVTDRALCGTRGGPCCLLTQTAPPCAASERSQHADSVYGYATNPSPWHSFLFLKIIFVLRIPHWTSRLGKAASCHANGRQSAPTTQPRVTSERTPQTHGTCSSIRQDWTKRRATQTKLRVKQNTLGVWEWKRSTCCCCC